MYNLTGLMIHFSTVIALFFPQVEQPDKSTRKANKTQQYAGKSEILLHGTNLLFLLKLNLGQKIDKNMRIGSITLQYEHKLSHSSSSSILFKSIASKDITLGLVGFLTATTLLLSLPEFIKLSMKFSAIKHSSL